MLEELISWSGSLVDRIPSITYIGLNIAIKWPIKRNRRKLGL